MTKFTDLPTLGQSLTGSETTALVATVSSTATSVQVPLSTIKTFMLTGTSTNATNLAQGGANQIPYQSALNTTAFVAAPVTTGTALIWNGTSLTWGSPNATATTLTGLLKGNGTVISAATAGTDYISASTTGQTITDTSGTTNYTLKIANGTTGAIFGIGTGNNSYGIANDALNNAINGYVPYTVSASTITLKTGTTSPATALSIASTGAVTISALIGTVSVATSSNTASSVGYLGLPQQSKSSTYTTVIGDQGKHIYVTSTAIMTIDSNANVPYPIGTRITFIAGSGATATISITSDTMYLSGSGSTGNRTLASFGTATAIKVANTTWIISGTGLT